MKSLTEDSLILIVDIGSTTTKGLLIEKVGYKYYFKAQSDSITTVERPYEDVNIGLERVVRGLEEKSGVKICDEGGNITIPFLATSSAGGGLQMLVFGLTKAETGKAAEATAYGAGAVITGSFAVDDGMMEMEKMRMIREVHPDMILMAGGIDGGGVWGTLRQAELLAMAEPGSKFMPEEQIPLVFCGNIGAREFVKDILGDHFHIHTTENIRPDLESFNFDPVRKKVHQLFMENVMENAPGYKKVKKSVSKDILPTPTGVELILKAYHASHKENMLLVDIGGATTDVFSCISSKINRTVSANTGMSYSLSNVLKEAGVEKISANLCGLINDNDIRNYISNKTLNPEYIPQSRGERCIELSCAAEGIRIAWEHHIGMNLQIYKMGYLDKRRRRVAEHDLCPFEEVFNLAEDKEILFQFSHVNRIIGAGGVISSSTSEEDVVYMLNEGFMPVGITEFYVDRYFKSPQTGMLSLIDPEKAVEVFERESLKRICTVVSLAGKSKEPVEVLSITDLNDNTTVKMGSGEVFFMKKGGRFRFEAINGFVFGTNGNVIETDLQSPILLDCRPRENGRNSSALFKALYGEKKELQAGHGALKGRNEIFRGEFDISRSLPYKGEMLVQKGEKVNIDTLIGRNVFNPPKIYMIDLRKHVGDIKLSKEEIISGLKIGKGDTVEYDQPVFSYKRKDSPVPYTYNSNVRGEVIKIDDYGMIVLKEIQDYDDREITVNVAAAMGIKPKELDRYLKYRTGDFVLRGQIIAQITSGSSIRDLLNAVIDSKTDKQHDGMVEAPGKHSSFKAFSTGNITKVDLTTGEITIQYKSKPFFLNSLVNGNIIEVHKDISADIRVNGSYAYCIIGFGGENFGRLIMANPREGIGERHNGSIAVFTEPVDKAVLEAAMKYKLKGVIAASVNNKDWVDFSGKEIGVAITGKEDIGFTFMLTEGFGHKNMNEDYIRYFTENEGKIASLNGRTRIRAGVIRPRIIIS